MPYSGKVKKYPPLLADGLTKCFHNGIILIVICEKFVMQI